MEVCVVHWVARTYHMGGNKCGLCTHMAVSIVVVSPGKGWALFCQCITFCAAVLEVTYKLGRTYQAVLGRHDIVPQYCNIKLIADLPLPSLTAISDRALCSSNGLHYPDITLKLCVCLHSYVIRF